MSISDELKAKYGELTKAPDYSSVDAYKSSMNAAVEAAVGSDPAAANDPYQQAIWKLQRLGAADEEEFTSKLYDDYNSFLEEVKQNTEAMSFEDGKSMYRSNYMTLSDLVDRSTALNDYLSVNPNATADQKKSAQQMLSDLNTLIGNFKSTQELYSQFDSEEAFNTAKQESAWHEKYNGKSVLELEDLLSSVEDDAEKTWLKKYKNSLDYDEKKKLDIDAYDRATQMLQWRMDNYDPEMDWTNPTERKAFDATLEEMGRVIDNRRAYSQAAKLIQEKEAGREKYDAIRENVDFSKFSSYDPNNQEIGYQYINADANGRADLEQQYGQYAEEMGYNSFDSLSDEEKEVYNYLMNIGNRQGAADYLKYLQEDLNYSKAEQTFQDGYEDNKLYEYIFAAEAGLDQFRSGVQGFGNLVAGREEYVPASYKQQMSGMIREDLGDGRVKMPEFMGGATVGQAVYDTINTSANMAPSILASAAIGILNPTAGAVAGQALLGMTASGNAYQEAINNGYSKDQARGYGLLVGTSEIIMEKVLGGLSGLGGNALGKSMISNLNAADGALKMLAKRLGGSMLSEFSEEYLQEVLSPVIENITLGTNEKTRLFSSDALYAGILGAMTSIVLEGGPAALETQGIKNTGKALQDKGITAERLAELGKTYSADTVAYQLACKVNENTDAYTMGRLFNELGASLSEQNQTDITNALAAEGMDLEIARKNAEVLNYIMEGGEVSDIQMKMIQKNDILSKVMKEVLIDENSTVNQRTRGYTKVAQTMSGRSQPIETQATDAQQPAGGQKQTKVVQGVSKKETATKSSYDLSGNGKTTYIPDGKEVKIKEIASVNKGKMTLKLEDGRTVDSKDIGYADSSEALVYESVAKMDVNALAANSLVKAYHPDSGVSAEVYVRGIQESYRYGEYGYPNKMGPFSSLLTEYQRNTAYKLGKIFSGKQVAKEQAKVANRIETAKKTAKGGVFFEGSDNSVTDWDSYANKPELKPTQEAAIQTMKVLSDTLGIKFYVGDYSKRTTKGGKSVNGFYDPKDGSIHIDLNAGMDSQKTMLFTLSHELTHFIRQWSPAKFKVLANFLMKEFSNHNNMDAWVHAKMKETGLKYADAYEEVVADAMEGMLADGKVMEKLAKLKQQDKTMWQKIKDFIDNWTAKLKEAYEGLKPDSAEGRAVLEMTDKLEEIQQLFAEGLAEAGENYQASQKTEAAETEPVDMAASVKKYSAIDSKNQKRITLSMTDSERAEILKNKVITAAVYEGQAKDSIESEKADLKSHEESLIKKALVRIGEEFGVFTDYSIADVNVDIRLSRGNLKESVQKEANPIQIAKMLPILRTAVENAVGIECHANRYFYDSNTVMFENMIGGFVEGNYFIPVRFGLKHSISGKATLYLIVDQEKIEINKIKAEVSKATVMHKHHADNTSRSAFNISLASIIPFVNSKDLLRYLPDNMLTRPQKDAKWEAIAETIVYTNNKNDEKYYKFIKSGNLIAAGQMVRQAAKAAGYDRMFFHGAKKGGGFTRFREWSYFTENKQYAERYAQRDNPGSLYTVYGKMENPFDTRDSKAKEIFDEIRNEYGLSELQDTGLPDWTDGYDITDYIDENDLDYDGVILDEGGDMVDGKPVSRGLSYVIRNSEQVKSADVITYDDDGNIIPISKRFDSSNLDIRYSVKRTKTYAEIEEERQELRMRERNLDERKRKALNDPELLKAMDDYSSLFVELKDLLSKKRNRTATRTDLDRIEEIKRSREETMERVVKLQESLGLKEIEQESEEIRKTKEDLRVASDEAWTREGAERENKAIEKAGVSASEYFRNKALKTFKTTTNFNEAGYILPDGKLLNFSGGERNHRYRDHREIGEIYEATQGAAALNRFMADGNIRIMAESPGVDITSGIEPTKEQYEALRKFVNSHGLKERKFFVDFSDKEGHRAGNYFFEGRVNADKVISDIKYYYSTGKIREQSPLTQFLYSVRDTENLSNRSLLMRVDESSPENPIEAKRLREYKETVAKADAEEQVLQELNEKIRTELNQKRVKELRFEANKSINRLAILDQQILRGEAGLKTVLEREQKMAYQRGDQKRKNAYEEYRINTEVEHLKTMREYRATREELHGLQDETKVMEKEFIRIVKEYEKLSEQSRNQNGKDAKTISDLRKKLSEEAKKHKAEGEKWAKKFTELLKEYDAADREISKLEAKIQQQRQSAKTKVDNRKKTEMRQKIRKVIRDLDKILNRGDKKRNVKEGLKDFVAEAISSAEVLFIEHYSNEDMVRSGVETELTAEEAKLLKEAQQIMNQLNNLPTGYEGWMARQEQEFKLKGKLSRRMAKLKDVFARERERLNRTTVATVLGNLADAYGKLQNSEQEHVQGAYHEAVYEYLKMLQEDIGGTVIKDMTLDQLEELYKAYTMVMTTVRNANKMFAENLNATRDALAKNVMREVRTVGGERKLWWKFGDKLNSFFWNNEKPVYAFERIGSDTLKTLYGNIRKGQDTWAADLQEANGFRQNIWNKYNYNKWDRSKEFKFTSSSGIDFELNLEQIMSIYAYSKRAQAYDHLMRGGFVFDDGTEVKVTKYKIPLTFLKKNATAYNLSLEILEDIISKLTPEQKAFVDEMQDYLSTTMGEKGNEVSMRLYGVKMFNEQFYFPLRSAGQYMERAKEADLKKEQGQVNLVNSGFSKATKIKASNPVVLSGFMEVWASHVNEMSMYHSFVLPMEDFRRVYNYSTPHTEEQQSASVNGVIQNAYGKAATDYIDQLYRDLNGGALTDNRTGVINHLMGLFKKGAVFASASVTIQQPSAIARATALIDTKYFVGTRVDAKKHDKTWAEVKRYAPMATIKEMGFFDTNMGRSATDFLTSQEYSGIAEKAKAFVTDGDYRDEKLSRAPALADELAWCSIWEAVKREIKDKHRNMDVRSEAFLQLAGERFSEVIDKTQVYDSVLARSANMRSKDTGMKMATAFMAEPTTSINMVMDALRKGKQGYKKQARKIIGSVVASVLLNSFLVAWVYAARDDDEDETYREKYLSAFVSGIKDGINPMTYIPFLKDIVSIVQGYDVERSDMSVISDLWNAYKQLENDDVSAWRKIEGFAGSICQIFGLPVKNIMRDLRSVYQFYDTAVNGEKNTTRGAAIAIVEGLNGQKPTNSEQLYAARKKGDEEHAERVEGRYDDEDSANAAVRNEITSLYMDDKLTLAQATMQLTQYAGMKPDEAYWLMNKWKYKKGHGGSDEGYSMYGDFYTAVTTGKNLKTVIQTYVDNGVKKETLSEQITEHFKEQYVAKSASERSALKGYLINAYEQTGMSRDKAVEKMKEWDFEAKYGFAYRDRKQAYMNGEVTAATLKTVLMKEGGYTAEDAAFQVEAYEWEKDGFEGATAAATRNYNLYCKSAGISKDMYMKIRKFSSDTNNDVDANGKEIAYSAMIKVMAEIDKLRISTAQKEALSKSMGWKDYNIKKYAPWRK